MPPSIVHADEVPETEGRYPVPFDDEGLGFGRDLGRAAGVERLGTWLERLPPGRRTARLHAHLREEETVYVLAGTPEVRWRSADGRAGVEALRPGSFVAFRAGTGTAHCIVNPGPGEARLLVVGERKPGERIAYPQDPDLEAWRAGQRSNRCWPDHAGVHPQARPPAWRIRTERLELRPWLPTDVPAYMAVLDDSRAHLSPWLPWAVDPFDEDEAVRRFMRFHGAFARSEEFVYGVFRGGEVVGGIGLHLRVGPQAAEVGYWLARAHTGQGYVTEAVRAVCQVGLGLHGYDRIEIRMEPENHRSAAVPARLGFALDPVLHRLPVRPEGPVDCQVWTLFREELPTLAQGGGPVAAWDLLDRRLL